MKKMILFALMACATTIFVGCSSVESGTKFSGLYITEDRSVPVAHLNGQVSGLYLFDTIPIFAGNTFDVGKSSFMLDTVKLEKAVSMVTRAARGYQATKVVDLHTEKYDDWLWYTFIFFHKEIKVSANAVK